MQNNTEEDMKSKISDLCMKTNFSDDKDAAIRFVKHMARAYGLDVRENVRGEWEYHDYGLDEDGRAYHEIECSACRVKLPMIREVDFDFCPWCGADNRR